jgi:hypothetical protein
MKAYTSLAVLALLLSVEAVELKTKVQLKAQQKAA